MWTLFVLCILGLNICQTTGVDNSTQMYYFKMVVEKSVIANITARLKTVVSSGNLKVDDLKMTTICQSVPDGIRCSCLSDFRWSDTVCLETDQKCCGDMNCTFTDKLARRCISNETVAVSGSITLRGMDHYDCLKENTTEIFKQCNNNLLQEMKRVYSTLAGFDILTINQYRVGSVIADFEVSFAHTVKQQELMSKTQLLISTLSASVDLETTGVVRLIMPPKSPVCYHDNPKLTCTLKEDLETSPVWLLMREGTVFEIFNGTESEVTTETLETRVTLRNISKLWEGKYTCKYVQQLSSINIIHKASGTMNISLLPKADLIIAPPFPHCIIGSNLLKVRVKCELEHNTDVYDVEWTGLNIVAGPFQRSPDSHASDVLVSCNETKDIPQVTCTLKNRCKEERTVSASVNVIYGTNQYCAAEGDWEVTKAGFSAVVKCTNATGHRERECKIGPTQGKWEPEVSTCVNRDVNNVLQKANVVDIGLGSLDDNAAYVFSLFGNVTKNSATINTFANLNTSVQVLSQMSRKIKSMNSEYTADDFLESSSNILEKSLNESWTSEANKGTISLAESYLDSFEDLIQKTNVTRVPKKKNVELAASDCPRGSTCRNTVFDTDVKLVSPDPGSVKTAGFKELENYLPNKDDTYQPNSIVVSVTTERKQSDSVQVQIKFSLNRPRPRNVNMRCVFWDRGARSWSTEGCEWQGASDEGLCVCRHLSSFAVLMSRSPVNIRGLTEVTLVGLSVSVVSLVLTLAIEVIVWNAVVKTDTSYLRHMANVNICLCLLVADCCFLASFNDNNKETWCKIFVALKHFSYLSMFFWMLCLSSMLLHQTVFTLHTMGRKTYLRFSLVLGYVCPLLISVITWFSYNNGAEGEYYSMETCWLCYAGLMKGSIYAFVIPVGIIVFVNVFSMVVVIIKLLNRPMTPEKYNEREKNATITVMRTVILLTPIFGVTWVLGFAVMLLDLTSGPIVFIVHYAFNLLNTFQGLFILVTTYLADQQTREALLKHLKKHLKKHAPASNTDSTTNLVSSWNK